MNNRDLKSLGCDGNGNVGLNPQRISKSNGQSQFAFETSRRAVIAGAALATIGWLQKSDSALAEIGLKNKKDDYSGDILVSVFMRGGADGLNLVPPYFEDGYYRHRPSINVASPKNNRVNSAARALDLDGRFGLHPALAPILPLFHEGKMGIVHACGSMDLSRSHFEAMSTMERGIKDQSTGMASGWIGRHLSTAERNLPSPLRAVAFSNVMPDSLRGATDATALNSLNEFRLMPPSGIKDASHHKALSALYADGKDAISIAGRETIAVLDTLNRIDPTHYKPGGNAQYPQSSFGEGMKQVACLIKGEVGLEVACVDHRGPALWDTHVAQDTVFGLQASDLAAGLSAFVADMGASMSRITMVIMTEFGRRVQENSGVGTDHGRGGAMFVIGGSVIGGKIHGVWPGLEDRQLDEVGDLRVANDYRDILAEVVRKRLHNDRLQEVFPDYSPHELGVFRG